MLGMGCRWRYATLQYDLHRGRAAGRCGSEAVVLLYGVWTSRGSRCKSPPRQAPTRSSATGGEHGTQIMLALDKVHLLLSHLHLPERDKIQGDRSIYPVQP